VFAVNVIAAAGDAYADDECMLMMTTPLTVSESVSECMAKEIRGDGGGGVVDFWLCIVCRYALSPLSQAGNVVIRLNQMSLKGPSCVCSKCRSCGG
jgi:hypothetical protein